MSALYQNNGGSNMEIILTKQQVAEQLHISVKTLDNWMQHGKGPKPVYMGKLVRFKQSDLDAFIQNLSGGK